MTSDLLVTLARNATTRAHLAGAEAAELERQADALAGDPPVSFDAATDDQRQAYALAQRAQAARRRYWREVAAVAVLTGHQWPEAEQLGVER